MNASFSKTCPSLQTYLDSTSIGEFKTCPRRYYYNIICGYQPRAESVHLTFGILLHTAVEHYWQLRKQNHSHDDALSSVVHETLKATWDSNLRRPWQSDNKGKNRFTLIRTIVWYLDSYQEDPIEILTINGKPAVELPFEFYSGIDSQLTGEPFVICGKLDRLGQLNGFQYVADVKSTQYTISQAWADQFTPDNQFTIYCIASKEVFKTETAGLILDGCQVVQTFSTFQRYLVDRTPFQLEEWQDDLRFHLINLDRCARDDKWPMNDKACNLYGGCPYRPVCSQRSATSREAILNSEYKRREWDPLTRRLDY